MTNPYSILVSEVMLKKRFLNLTKRTLIDKPATSAKITSMLKLNPKQVRKVCTQLKKEGFIIKKREMYSIGR